MGGREDGGGEEERGEMGVVPCVWLQSCPNSTTHT